MRDPERSSHGPKGDRGNTWEHFRWHLHGLRGLEIRGSVRLVTEFFLLCHTAVRELERFFNILNKKTQRNNNEIVRSLGRSLKETGVRVSSLSCRSNATALGGTCPLKGGVGITFNTRSKKCLEGYRLISPKEAQVKTCSYAHRLHNGQHGI